MPVSYRRDRFPPDELDWPQLIPLAGPAHAAIARYDGAVRGIPNPDLFLGPLAMQEAVLSSRIEGTQATLAEVLEYEAEGNLEDESTAKKADIREVRNYRAALAEGARLLEQLPLSQRLIKQAHKTLMQGVRGKNKSPGEYRAIPNWIGAPGSTPETATFIPCGAEHLPDAMSAWEKHMHADSLDPLVQLALLHAEFEAIHPFLDGNGRLGRLIIPLFLKDKGLLAHPNFYVSGYLERHRDEYYARLLAVSRDGDWTGWCAFFLKALIAQGEENHAKSVAIMDLYDDYKVRIVDIANSKYAILALDWIFKRPIFRTAEFVSSSGIPKSTAQRFLQEAEAKEVLRKMHSPKGRRSAIFCFDGLLRIVK